MTMKTRIFTLLTLLVMCTAGTFAQEKKVLESILWQAMPFVRRGHVASAKPYWSHGGAPSILVTAQSLYEALMSIKVEGK